MKVPKTVPAGAIHRCGLSCHNNNQGYNELVTESSEIIWETPMLIFVGMFWESDPFFSQKYQ